jgi:hypothetical protein
VSRLKAFFCPLDVIEIDLFEVSCTTDSLKEIIFIEVSSFFLIDFIEAVGDSVLAVLREYVFDALTLPLLEELIPDRSLGLAPRGYQFMSLLHANISNLCPDLEPI